MPLTDMNDLDITAGPDAVRKLIAAAVATPATGSSSAKGPTKRRRVGAAVASSAAIELSEDSLAQAFVTSHLGRVVYVHGHKQWLIYCAESGTYYPDRTELVAHWVREFVRGLNRDHQARWGAARVINAVESLARRDPDIAVESASLDADPWLLGTPGGPVDLRTGVAAAASPKHLITKRTAVSPKAGPPEAWLRFLMEATGGDVEVVDFLQRLAGYVLSGDTSEECLTFIYGPGGNGKGVFMGALQAVLGDYARAASMDVFLESRNDRHPADLAALFGARLVVSSESAEGRRWDEQRIKAMTGRDVISARFMGGNFFEFQPQFKIVIASNHKPRIRSVDQAWRRRLLLVPFERQPARPDPGLKDALRAEYGQILTWAMEGAEWWRREGLCPPAAIRSATDEYFHEEDLPQLWFDECCEVAPASVCADRNALFRSYQTWCNGNGHEARTLHALTRWFRGKGYAQKSTDAKRPMVGVRLRDLAS